MHINEYPIVLHLKIEALYRISSPWQKKKISFALNLKGNLN